MKKLIIIVFIMTLITSCHHMAVDFNLITFEEVPDSLQREYQDYLIELVSASNQHHSAGKSKNKGDLLYTAKYIADDKYVSIVKKLTVSSSALSSTYIPYRTYTYEEALESGYGDIFEYLLTKPLGYEITKVYNKKGELKR